MRDKSLYARILGLEQPWEVVDVELELGGEGVVVRIERSGRRALRCPECGARCGRHDSRLRRWRHLDTCQYPTVLVAQVPRVRCAECGVRQVEVPWASQRARFTKLFEALVIDWLKEASIKAVAEQMGLSWDEVDGIMQRAVRRGLKRREQRLPRRPALAVRRG